MNGKCILNGIVYWCECNSGFIGLNCEIVDFCF